MSRSRAACCARAVRTGAYPPRVCRHEEKAVGKATKKVAKAVDTALRGLPSHGWTQGMFGRRDRCLLVLSQLAGVPYQHLATLTAGDISIADGAATIRSSSGEWTADVADEAV